MILLLLGLGPAVDPTEVSGSALAVYGIAAPFALLCLLLAFLFRKERDDWRSKAEEKDERIELMHQEALKREQALVSGLGPRIYDAALLYREGTRMAEQVAAAPPAPVEQRLDELTHAVDRLIDGMGSPGAD